MAEQSFGRMTLTRVELPSGEVQALAEIIVSCPACGTLTFRVPGHHFKMVRDMMIEALDLLGAAADEETTKVLNRDHVSFTKGTGGDPSQN